jgi:mono/diheme cytochrome c family protein
MADFVSGFWNAYVMVLVFLSIAFCVFVLVSNNKKRTSGPVGLHDHIWDETLQEYNNPLPRWWMYMFWITIIFAIVYLAMYPGFGNNQGKLGWSSGGQWEAEQKAAAEKYGPIFAKFRTMDLNAVAGDKEANAMGQRLFLTYCAQCHGADAKGAKGFPNLTDSDWLYGGEPETIKTTVLGGRQGMMPPFGPALGADGQGCGELCPFPVRSGPRLPARPAWQGALCPELRGLSRSGSQGHARSRRAEPDRQDLAVWFRRSDHHRDRDQRSHQPDAGVQGLPWRRQGSSAGSLCSEPVQERAAPAEESKLRKVVLALDDSPGCPGEFLNKNIRILLFGNHEPARHPDPQSADPRRQKLKTPSMPSGKGLSPRRYRPVRHLAVDLVWATQLIFYGLCWLPWEIGRPFCWMWSSASSTSSAGFLAPGRVLPGDPADHQCLFAVLLHRGGGAPVVWLCLPADGLYRDLHVDRGEDRGQPQPAHEAGRGADEWPQVGIKAAKFGAWGAIPCGQASPGRLLHADPRTGQEALTFSFGPWELFWIFFYGGFTYLFAGVMREQVCKYMCPYARFQG